MIDQQDTQTTSKELLPLEARVRVNHLTNIAQEQRTTRVFQNLSTYWSTPDAGEKKAAVEAFVHWILPGKMAAIVISIGLGGVFTIMLMHQNNELVAEQNYELRRQIHEQALTDRAARIADIKDKLYRQTNFAENDLSKRTPYFGTPIRQESLEQYMEIQSRPMIAPVKPIAASLCLRLSEWPFGIFRHFCEHQLEADTPHTLPPPKANSEIPEDPELILDLREALLSSTDWNFFQRFEHRRILRLADSNLENANLQTIDLTSTFLTNANLIRANLSGANLASATFDHSDLTEADLRSANLDGTSFTSARMIGATLNSTVSTGAKFDHAVLRKAEFFMSTIDNSSFYGADLNEASISETKVSNSNMTDADLTSAYMWYAQIEETQFKNTNLTSANLKQAIITNSHFPYAKLPHVNLTGARLTGSSFLAADLGEAIMNRAYIHDSSLWKANLAGASLEGTILENVYLSGANLSNANLAGAFINQVNLTDADLENTNLANVTGLTCEQLTSALNWQQASNSPIQCANQATPN